jgi:hypothetical protein
VRAEESERSVRKAGLLKLFFCNVFKRKKSVYSDLASCSLSSSLRLAAAAFLRLMIGQKNIKPFSW